MSNSRNISSWSQDRFLMVIFNVQRKEKHLFKNINRLTLKEWVRIGATVSIIRGGAIPACHNVTISKYSFKRENTCLWKGATFTFTQSSLIWRPNQRLMEGFNLKAEPLAFRQERQLQGSAKPQLGKEMVTLLGCFKDLKALMRIDLELTFLQFGHTCRRDRESMDSFFS